MPDVVITTQIVLDSKSFLNSLKTLKKSVDDVMSGRGVSGRATAQGFKINLDKNHLLSQWSSILKSIESQPVKLTLDMAHIRSQLGGGMGGGGGGGGTGGGGGSGSGATGGRGSSVSGFDGDPVRSFRRARRYVNAQDAVEARANRRESSNAVGAFRAARDDVARADKASAQAENAAVQASASHYEGRYRQFEKSQTNFSKEAGRWQQKGLDFREYSRLSNSSNPNNWGAAAAMEDAMSGGRGGRGSGGGGGSGGGRGGGLSGSHGRFSNAGRSAVSSGRFEQPQEGRMMSLAYAGFVISGTISKAGQISDRLREGTISNTIQDDGEALNHAKGVTDSLYEGERGLAQSFSEATGLNKVFAEVMADAGLGDYDEMAMSRDERREVLRGAERAKRAATAKNVKIKDVAEKKIEYNLDYARTSTEDRLKYDDSERSDLSIAVNFGEEERQLSLFEAANSQIKGSKEVVAKKRAEMAMRANFQKRQAVVANNTNVINTRNDVSASQSAAAVSRLNTSQNYSEAQRAQGLDSINRQEEDLRSKLTLARQTDKQLYSQLKPRFDAFLLQADAGRQEINTSIDREMGLSRRSNLNNYALENRRADRNTFGQGYYSDKMNDEINIARADQALRPTMRLAASARSRANIADLDSETRSINRATEERMMNLYGNNAGAIVSAAYHDRNIAISAAQDISGDSEEILSSKRFRRGAIQREFEAIRKEAYTNESRSLKQINSQTRQIEMRTVGNIIGAQYEDLRASIEQNEDMNAQNPLMLDANRKNLRAQLKQFIRGTSRPQRYDSADDFYREFQDKILTRPDGDALKKAKDMEGKLDGDIAGQEALIKQLLGAMQQVGVVGMGGF